MAFNFCYVLLNLPKTLPLYSVLIEFMSEVKVDVQKHELQYINDSINHISECCLFTEKVGVQKS